MQAFFTSILIRRVPSLKFDKKVVSLLSDIVRFDHETDRPNIDDIRALANSRSRLRQFSDRFKMAEALASGNVSEFFC